MSALDRVSGSFEQLRFEGSALGVCVEGWKFRFGGEREDGERGARVVTFVSCMNVANK